MDMFVRTAFAAIGLNIANYMAVIVNERTGGFQSSRRRFIGLFWTCVMLLTFPLNVCTSYRSPLLISASTLGMADFGNSRELSLRWMLYLADESSPLRWIQALGKHIHHSGVLAITAFILSYGIDGDLRPIADKALLADYVVALCHLCVMLRFENVAKWLMYVPGLVALVAAVAFAIPIAAGSVGSTEEYCFRGLIGFSFTGTLLCNLLGAVGGGYVRSRRRVEANIRGCTKKRSVGGLAFEQWIASIHVDDSFDCEEGIPASEVTTTASVSSVDTSGERPMSTMTN